MLSNNVAPMERTGPLGELLGLFDVVVESSVEGVRKPEPEIYERALARLSDAVGRRLEAADCAYLDDLGINLKPARALGLHTIKVVEPADALAELSALVGFPLDGAGREPRLPSPEVSLRRRSCSAPAVGRARGCRGPTVGDPGRRRRDGPGAGARRRRAGVGRHADRRRRPRAGRRRAGRGRQRAGEARRPDGARRGAGAARGGARCTATAGG